MSNLVALYSSLTACSVCVLGKKSSKLAAGGTGQKVGKKGDGDVIEFKEPSFRRSTESSNIIINRIDDSSFTVCVFLLCQFCTT